LVFRETADEPLIWIRYGRFQFYDAGWDADRCAFYTGDATHSGEILEQSRLVDRIGIRGDISRGGGKDAALS
jgi:hypothetical protein